MSIPHIMVYDTKPSRPRAKVCDSNSLQKRHTKLVLESFGVYVAHKRGEEKEHFVWLKNHQEEHLLP